MSDDFLHRWSRRKRASDETSDEADTARAEPERPAPELPDQEDEAELLARLGLKHPDRMGAGDDFAAFLKAAVPQHLKTRALRRLWRSNPTLACLDGLNDYDGDFTGTGVPAGGLKTSYEVGRGLLRRIAEAADEAEVAEAPASEPAVREAAAEEPPVAPSPERPAATVAQHGHEDEAPARAARRRMAFRTTAHPRGS